MATQTKTKVTITPLSDRVVIEPDEAVEKTSGGIYLPDTAKEKPIQGTVVGVGCGTLLKDGRRQPLTVKKGDRVIFGKYSGTEVKIDGVDFTIAREQDLLGILD